MSEAWVALMGYLELECPYCNEKVSVMDFHHSYRMQVKNMKTGEVEPSAYLLTCPHCEKTCEMTSITLEMIKK